MSDDNRPESLRVVSVCRGHRCEALLAQQPRDGLHVLRETVAATTHGVLVSTGCVGACAHAPVVRLGTGEHRDGGLSVHLSHALGPVRADAMAALAEHLRTRPDADLPAELRQVQMPTAVPAGPFARGR